MPTSSWSSGSKSKRFSAEIPQSLRLKYVGAPWGCRNAVRFADLLVGTINDGFRAFDEFEIGRHGE